MERSGFGVPSFKDFCTRLQSEWRSLIVLREQIVLTCSVTLMGPFASSIKSDYTRLVLQSIRLLKSLARVLGNHWDPFSFTLHRPYSLWSTFPLSLSLSLLCTVYTASFDVTHLLKGTTQYALSLSQMLFVSFTIVSFFPPRVFMFVGVENLISTLSRQISAHVINMTFCINFEMF
jgi:hypothetical protein